MCTLTSRAQAFLDLTFHVHVTGQLMSQSEDNVYISNCANLIMTSHKPALSHQPPALESDTNTLLLTFHLSFELFAVDSGNVDHVMRIVDEG